MQWLIAFKLLTSMIFILHMINKSISKTTVLFYCTTFLLFPFYLRSQKKIIYPKEFPQELIGKKLCGQISTTGKMFGGSTAFLKLPVEIFISKDLGIYASYNPGEQFHENKWGETQKIDVFNLWKTIPRTDQYGDLLGIEYHYKVPQCDWLNGSGHCISALYVYDFYGSQYVAAGKFLSISVSVPSYEAAHIYTGYKDISICGQLKTKLELQKEEEERIKIEQKRQQEELQREKKEEELRKKEEEERIKIENQRKDLDKVTVVKIDSLLALNLIENAALSYDKLYFSNLELKNKIQVLLEKKHENDTIIMDDKTIINYIKYHTKTNNNQLLRLAEGVHEIRFNTNGSATKALYSNINIGFGVAESSVNIPTINVGSFKIRLNSKMKLNIVNRDSILVQCKYSSGCDKPLYMDNHENFFLKIKKESTHPITYVFFDSGIIKETVRINKTFKSEKQINGVIVETKYFNTENFVDIQKKEK